MKDIDNVPDLLRNTVAVGVYNRSLISRVNQHTHTNTPLCVCVCVCV